MSVSLADQVRCLVREVRMRERVYPRWVEAGKMTQAKADEELGAMRAARDTLEAIVLADTPAVLQQRQAGLL